MNPHVFTTAKSAPLGSSTSSYPSRRNKPSMRSLSTRFFGQPRLTNAYRPLLVRRADSEVKVSNMSAKEILWSGRFEKRRATTLCTLRSREPPILAASGKRANCPTDKPGETIAFYALNCTLVYTRFMVVEFARIGSILMLSDIPDDEFAAAIAATASEALWQAGVNEPPVDALTVAEGLQLVVARDYTMPYRGRFVRLAERHENATGGGQGTIVVGVAERPEREQWAVAHEIGESIAYRVFDRLGVKFDEALPTAREHVATGWRAHCCCRRAGSPRTAAG